MQHRHDDERGTVTLWVLGLCVAVMFLGGIGLDLWRAIAVRRELSAMADAAATAAANGVDEAALRAGTVHLDDARVRELAYQSLATSPRAASLDAQEVDLAGDRVTVILRDDVPFALLRIFMGGDRFEVRVHATAEPRLVP
jgi:type II secretory pathway component PulM